MSQVNILGEGFIAGARYVKDIDAFIAKNEARYINTPVFAQEIIPQGRYAHIGDGVFFRRCSACDDFILTYGTVSYIREFAEHEASHGLDVPGYNVPLLPR